MQEVINQMKVLLHNESVASINQMKVRFFLLNKNKICSLKNNVFHSFVCNPFYKKVRNIKSFLQKRKFLKNKIQIKGSIFLYCFEHLTACQYFPSS